MYVIKRTSKILEGVYPNAKAYSYYTYDGWTTPSVGPLDLTGCVLFTEQEARVNELPPNEEFQWYGAYKR